MGTLAVCLILDRHYLHCDQPAAPLLDEKDLDALCLTVLERDDCPDIREYRGSNRWETWCRFGKLAERDLADLRKLRPDLPVWQIVKAIGRLPASEAAERFLRAVVIDEDASRFSRLAAFSALTRAGYEYVVPSSRTRSNVNPESS